MDVLTIFENILFRYSSTIGLKPLLEPVAMDIEPPSNSSSEVLYVRKPEPPTSIAYSVEKLERDPSLLRMAPLPRQSKTYVQQDQTPTRIDLETIIG